MAAEQDILSIDRAGVVRRSVERFYARQVQLLGAGDIDAWAETFTEDALFEQHAQQGRVFARNAAPERRGRDRIAAAARGAVAQRGDDGVVRRYWIGMIDARPLDDGTVRTHYYAVLVQTPRGEGSAVHMSTTGEDVLVPHGGSWRVRYRLNSHDDVHTTKGRP